MLAVEDRPLTGRIETRTDPWRWSAPCLVLPFATRREAALAEAPPIRKTSKSGLGALTQVRSTAPLPHVFGEIGAGRQASRTVFFLTGAFVLVGA